MCCVLSRLKLDSDFSVPLVPLLRAALSRPMVDAGRELLGVSTVSATGVDWRERREDDRGVIFALTKLPTGVTLSSANVLVVGIGVVCAVVERLIGGVLLYPASLGAGEARWFCAEAAKRGINGLWEPLAVGSLRLVADMAICYRLCLANMTAYATEVAVPSCFDPRVGVSRGIA